MSNELELNKDRADADRYYKLFADKVGKFEDGERILFIHIGNFDVLDRFIQSNPNCSYFIIDQHLNGLWFEMSWSCKFIGTNEDDSIVEALDTLNMKFDKIIMNPPYTKNLHLKILAKAIEKLNEKGVCINLSPVRWLQDPLVEYKDHSDYKKFKESICKHITNLDEIDSRTAENIFSIRFPTDIGIYETNRDLKEPFILVNKILLSIIKKTISKDNCIRPHIEYGKLEGWRVRINGIGGGAHPGTFDRKTILHFGRSNTFKDGYQDGTGNFWTETGKSKNQYSKKIGDPFPTSIPFNSFKEAKNFEESTRTKFMHFLNIKCKLDMNFVDLLPWMGDAVNPRTGKKGYESEWTDEDFYKYFGITEDEQKLIEETMEKYK